VADQDLAVTDKLQIARAARDRDRPTLARPALVEVEQAVPMVVDCQQAVLCLELDLVSILCLSQARGEGQQKDRNREDSHRMARSNSFATREFSRVILSVAKDLGKLGRFFAALRMTDGTP
jgi:hypothetical protein